MPEFDRFCFGAFNGCFVSAALVVEKANAEADDFLRTIFPDDYVWPLAPHIFYIVVNQFLDMRVDFFPSKLNCKILAFISHP